jgi:arsenite methyltransferase
MTRSNPVIQAIDQRYSKLADTSCCLSCGGAADLSEAAEGEVCVDLGSGQGADVLKLAGRVKAHGFVYGIDTSSAMLRRAKRTAEKMAIANVAFIESEFADLKLEDGVANLLISNCSINHAPDKPRVWAEIFRVLKPGGRFVVSDIYALEPVPAAYRDDPEAVAECWAGAVTRAEYLATLKATGFTAITILEESKPYDKGKIVMASFTVAGKRPGCCCKTP